METNKTMSKKKKAAAGAKADPILSFTKVYVEKHLKELKKTSEKNEMYELLVEFMEPFIRLHHKDIHDDMMANHQELLEKIARLEAKIDNYGSNMSSVLGTDIQYPKTSDSSSSLPCRCSEGSGSSTTESMQVREEERLYQPESLGDVLNDWWPEGTE